MKGSVLLRSPWQTQMKIDGGTSDPLLLVIETEVYMMCRLAQRAERDLQAHLTREDSIFPDISHFLAQYTLRTPRERHI